MSESLERRVMKFAKPAGRYSLRETKEITVSAIAELDAQIKPLVEKNRQEAIAGKEQVLQDKSLYKG